MPRNNRTQPFAIFPRQSRSRSAIAKILLAVPLSTLASCATINRYESPNGDSAVPLTIRTLDKAHINIGVVSYRGDTYLESKGDVVGILHSRTIGYEYTDEIKINALANHEFRFSTKVGDLDVKYIGQNTNKFTGRVCQTHTSFIPRVGAKYLAEHDSTTNGCEVKIYLIDSQGNKLAEPTAKLLKSCLDPWLTGGAFKDGLCPPSGFDFR